MQSSVILPPRLIVDTCYTTKSIISYGLMVYALDTKKWILVRRRNTLHFSTIVRGNYRPSHLGTLLTQISRREAKLLIECLPDNVDKFEQLYKSKLKYFDDDYEYAKIKFYSMKDLMIHYLLLIDYTGKGLSWMWPKGRLNQMPLSYTPYKYRSFTNYKPKDFGISRGTRKYMNANPEVTSIEEQNEDSKKLPKKHEGIDSFDTTYTLKDDIILERKESPFGCSIREFMEEVGCKIPDPVFVSHEIFVEKTKSLSGKIFETKLWLYVVDKEFETPQPSVDDPEVSKRKWFNTDEVIKLIPSCKENLERIIKYGEYPIKFE